MEDNEGTTGCQRQHYPYTWANAVRSVAMVAGVCFIIWVLMGHG